MAAPAFTPRIGIYGPDDVEPSTVRGCALWPIGYFAAVEAANGTPVPIELPRAGVPWDDVLAEVDGLLFLGYEKATPRQAANEERLCQWCRDRELPLLGIDKGMHVLNSSFGGTLYTDLPKELPLALQHRHPPEPGVRHAINVEPGTRLCQLYGEGEIVVNSEHTRALARVARGFRVSGRALDGVVECIEAETDGWFALGVQWHPASATASGLDIQLFRGLVDACKERHTQALPLSYAA